MTPEAHRTSYLTMLRKQLVEYFLREELMGMCSHLGINYGELREGPIGIQAMEIVQHLDRQGRISDLVEYCSARRPRVFWGDNETPVSDQS